MSRGSNGRYRCWTALGIGGERNPPDNERRAGSTSSMSSESSRGAVLRSVCLVAVLGASDDRPGELPRLEPILRSLIPFMEGSPTSCEEVEVTTTSGALPRGGKSRTMSPALCCHSLGVCSGLATSALLSCVTTRPIDVCCMNVWIVENGTLLNIRATRANMNASRNSSPPSIAGIA